MTGYSLTDDEREGAVPYLWDGRTMQRLGTEADTFDFGFGNGLDVNDAGQVTGFFGDEEGFEGESTAFRSDGTTIQNLGTLGGFRVAGRAINASGQVAGFSTMANFQRRAFFWNGTTMQNLGTFGGTESDANDINAAGHVTGFATTTNNAASHAFLWNGTTLRDLGTLGGGGSEGVAINSSGHVAGLSYIAGGVAYHAFLWNGNRMIDLGALGGDYSRATAINRASQITGWAEVAAGQQHAFLWDGSAMLDLGTPVFGSNSAGRAINALGQVTGEFFPADDGQFHAFIWNGIAMWDLNAVVDPSDPLKSFVRLDTGVDINRRGQIAVNGRDKRTSQRRAYLVTPLEYKIVFIEPAANSQWQRSTTVPVKVALVGKDGKRIADSRAVLLLSAPCKVTFSATGAQPRSPVCMKYDAATNEFFFNWKPSATANIGVTNLVGAATYKFSMPQTITTKRARTITITQQLPTQASRRG